MTPPMTDIASLIERLENTTGPDRELDCAIMQMEVDRGAGLHVRLTEDSLASAPHYTSSIDAAVTLVPPRHTIAIRSYGDGTWRASLRSLDDPSGEWILGGENKTGAIPICIAALRARTQCEPEKQP